MIIEEPCYCGGQLIADGQRNSLGHYHAVCVDCKRGWFHIAKNINDGNIGNDGDLNEQRTDEVQKSGATNERAGRQRTLL